MGVPTGGSLCVQLANITVFYVTNYAVYSKPEMMANVVEAKRYIDDGAGWGIVLFLDIQLCFDSTY